MKPKRWLFSTLVCACVLSVAGCSLFKSKKGATASPPPSKGKPSSKPGPKLIVTPSTGLSGKVASVNAAGQFVVISFPPGQVPAPDQALNVYRSGLKVGEVRMSRERQGQNAVADIVAGEARAGDDVRAE